MSHPRWAEAAPDPHTYRPTGLSPAEIKRQQDEAAGGAANRTVRLEDGSSATASIALKGMGRRVYAYLRYKTANRTITRYVGEAPGEERFERLVNSWRTVRDRGLLHQGDDE